MVWSLPGRRGYICPSTCSRTSITLRCVLVKHHSRYIPACLLLCHVLGCLCSCGGARPLCSCCGVPCTECAPSAKRVCADQLQPAAVMSEHTCCDARQAHLNGFSPPTCSPPPPPCHRKKEAQAMTVQLWCCVFVPAQSEPRETLPQALEKGASISLADPCNCRGNQIATTQPGPASDAVLHIICSRMCAELRALRLQACQLAPGCCGQTCPVTSKSRLWTCWTPGSRRCRRSCSF